MRPHPHVACVLLNHSVFTIAGARKWVRDNGYRIRKQGDGLQISNRYFHFRQHPQLHRPGIRYRFIIPSDNIRLMISSSGDSDHKRKRRRIRRKGKRRQRDKQHRQGKIRKTPK